MMRVFLAGLAIGASCGATYASSLEHWTCQERIGYKEWPQEYTLADNRMFAPKGKGSWPLVYNSAEVAVAYLRLQGNAPPVATFVYVLDKRSGKMIWYDDGLGMANIEPDIHISPCRRLN